MKKYFNAVVFFSLSAILITGCDKEEEDLIPHPSDTSTILTGQIATPDGMPLADIPVSVDYTFKSIFGTSLIHKAKGCTDKSGFYKIFFEFQEDGITDFRSSLVFSVDLSTLPADDYYIATKLDYHFPADNEWLGKNIDCTFTIPRKTDAKVVINNRGDSIKEGYYAVMNKIPFFRCDFVYSCGIRLWDAYNDIYWFEDVDIPQDNSVSLTLPCAVGVTNSIQVVYKGNDTIRYGIGKPCSDMKELFLSDKQDEEIVFDYFTPDSR
jgi:hypothetical protein